ncbi:TCR/Tet family MFS transporter [Trinickia terrae]|uniref:TCR/Tet family MFS transporter n=1 Tax=Trinickia terrae TaxID=2571161 RepID=A0A4U1IA51_9BURK|nr:TCR/Tet family MFS transporter [Trinickia terrae]TKC90317.1 TCR/Tet family MFS transporter [Trinickia terrae]
MNTSAQARGGHGSRAAFGFVFVTALMNAVSFGIVLPVLPNLIKAFAGGDTSRAAQWSTLFSVVWGVMQFVCGPAMGALSDRIGRRPVLLISLVGLAADFFIMAFAPNLMWLLAGRIVNGMTAASFATANAYIADVTAPDERARAFGRIGAALSLGFLAGPALGGLLATAGLRVPFFVAGALTAMNALYGLLVLPESLPVERRTSHIDWGALSPLGALRFLGQRAGLLQLSLIGGLFSFAWMVGPSIFVLYGGYRYGWLPATIGIVMMASGLIGAVTQMNLVGPVVARMGERGAMLIGAAAAAVGYACFGCASAGWGYLAAIPVFALHHLFMPGLQGLMTSRLGESEQARLQGVVQGVQGIASIIGPLVFGLVFAWSSGAESAAYEAGCAFFLASGVMALVFVLAARIG